MTADDQTDGSVWDSTADESGGPRELKIDQPHSARIYDWFLGGKDNFAADRAAGDQIERAMPSVRLLARENRAFMTRAVRYLAAEEGVRQFLDLGTGIPTSPNLHEVAQRIAPDTRVVYADNDPIVLAHARALLIGSPEGRTAYLDADLLEPEQILAAPELTETLDLTRPVALCLVAVLHFIRGDAPFDIVRTLLAALPAGSFLVISHGTNDLNPASREASDEMRQTGVQLQPRNRDEIERFFDGLTLVDPGIQVIHRWRPEKPPVLSDAEVNIYGAIGRK
jgi:hypothetical protein